MLITRLRITAAAALLVLALLPLHASSPKFFQAATQADFLKGDVENLSIDSHGQLTLGPATELVYETPAPFLWTMVPAPDGSLFVGTGNEGKVFRVDAQGKGSLFFDSAELEVHALAPAPNGGLYVGTSPDGQIYKVDRNGSRDDVLRSGRQVHLGAGRRCQGQPVRRHRRQGRRSTRSRPTARARRSTRPRRRTPPRSPSTRPATCWSAPASPGRVLRVDADGQGVRAARHAVPGDPRAALRRQGRAVRRRAQRPPGGGGGAVAADDRTLDRPTPDPSRAPVPSVSTEITSIVDRRRRRRIGDRAATPREDRRAPKGAVYRIAPDGVWDQLWESRDDSPYDLDLRSERRADRRHRRQGQALSARRRSAAADAARARRRAAGHRVLQGRARPAVLRDRESRESCSGCRRSARRAAPTSRSRATRRWCRPGARSAGAARRRPAAASRCSRAPATPRRPTTPGAPGRRPYTNADGSPITSPKARYLQWRAVLTGKGDGPGADLGHRRLPAAQPAAAGALDHRASAGHRVPEAVLDRRSGARRLRRSDDARAQAGRGRERAAGQRVGARPPDVSEGAADARLEGRRRERRRPRRTTCCTGARARRRGRRCARRRQRPDPRLGHDDGPERHLLREDRRVAMRRRTRRAPR